MATKIYTVCLLLTRSAEIQPIVFNTVAINEDEAIKSLMLIDRVQEYILNGYSVCLKTAHQIGNQYCPHNYDGVVCRTYVGGDGISGIYFNLENNKSSKMLEDLKSLISKHTTLDPDLLSD